MPSPAPRTLAAAFVVGLLVGCSSAGPEPSPPLDTTPGTGLTPTEEAAFLDEVQEATFRWFWETTNPANGLVPDRAPSRPFSSIAAVGFGLTAYGVGAEHGYVTREEAAERTLATLRFFANSPQGPDKAGMTGYRGFYYHFLEMDTGVRFRNTELSSIDTALLMMGVLFAQEYFDADTPDEEEIRRLAEDLYRRVEWDWMQPRAPLIAMGWRPADGLIPHDYRGLDEAMFLYMLGLGSPTHPVDPAAWDAYTSTYVWDTFYTYEYVQFTPLFGYQYSHVWIDPRGLQDAYLRERGIDYHENARRATLAQRAYAIDNPGDFADYGPDTWGLTACDGPANEERVVDGRTVQFRRYWARGASARDIRDDGTIAPTAAGGSVPYAPEVAIRALHTMRERYGDLLFNEWGFVDAFNPTFTFTDATNTERGTIDPERGWFDSDHLGIDQGPILLMIENHRTGFIWDVMRDNPHIVRGLCRAGFTADWLSCEG